MNRFLATLSGVTLLAAAPAVFAIPIPTTRRIEASKGTGNRARGTRGSNSVPRSPFPGPLQLELLGCRHHNLRNVDLRIPLGTLVCVTGVSGSGKSSLIEGTLARAVARRLHQAGDTPGPFAELRGVEHLRLLVGRCYTHAPTIARVRSFAHDSLTTRRAMPARLSLTHRARRGALPIRHGASPSGTPHGRRRTGSQASPYGRVPPAPRKKKNGLASEPLRKSAPTQRGARRVRSEFAPGRLPPLPNPRRGHG